ncbi:MAG TPA: hypothetical protein VFX85_08855 [Solirubrobacterales bacterium]|nr:hypothetical protein [Solirubrobacterales bacterium]
MRGRLAVAAVSLAALLATFFASSAMQPQKAHAWAWKDTCTLIVFNKTGAQSNVHPILYTPLLPNPASVAEYAAFAVTGIPTEGAAAFTNTGYPAPSYGCHAFMNFTNPGPTVSCKVSAPTTGANTFSCEGNATTRIIKDDDDIAGNVFIPSGSGSPGQDNEADEPKDGDAAVRAGALPGDGWRKSLKITEFGLAGKLMDNETLPNKCGKDGDEVVPNAVSSEQLIRGGGKEGVGAIVSTYDNAGQAKRGLNEALSDLSIACLANLLSSNEMGTKVAIKPLPAAGDGDVEGNQLVISRAVNGDQRPVAYLNAFGWTEGNEAAVVLVETVGDAPDGADEDAVVKATRIG